MSFASEVRKVVQLVETRQKAVFVGVVNGVHGSVTQGSALTGAPGQPVDTGNLLASWQETFPEEWIGQTATNAVYATAIEDGIQEPYERASGQQVTPQPMTLRSSVGGFHSAALTEAGYEKIVEATLGEVVRD